MDYCRNKMFITHIIPLSFIDTKRDSQVAKVDLHGNPAWKVTVFFLMDSISLTSLQCISGG